MNDIILIGYKLESGAMTIRSDSDWNVITIRSDSDWNVIAIRSDSDWKAIGIRSDSDIIIIYNLMISDQCIV
jgi:hypothetical protein